MSVGDRIHTVRTLAEAGVLRPLRPDKVVGIGRALRRFGPTPAAGYAASAIRHPDRTAIVDELGSLSFGDVHRRTNALAHALADRGVVEGDGMAIMCRNHRGFVEATVAGSKLGVDALYLNTSFAGPQITEVVKRENPRAIVFDEEFSELVEDAARRRKRFIAWHGEGKLSDPTLDQLTEEGDPEDVVAPAERGKAVILTSGTTGAPKGASRSQPKSLDPAAVLLSKIPLRSREPTMLAAPLFHSWGFAHFSLGLSLGSTLVLRRKFDPEETLSATAQHRCTTLVVVPVMVQRILELPPETIDRYDLSALRVIAISGSALSPSLAQRAMDRFGDVLYNLYGSTEVAWAAIATPEDMRAAPGSVGKPPRGTILKLYDEEGEEVDQGETGRIFVANDMLFEGYTGGGSKDVINGLMATGDVGHLDEGGRLFVDGRDDEMIVSGGENVFPQEVEELLAAHDGVADVAVVGVEDEEFGQRLRAVIVRREGAKLDDKDVQEHVKRNLANYKSPRDVVFVDELPRTSTGKVLKRELTDAEN
ncbi:MAG: AMP-binding protein [Chloroflexota bacterium]|nr:AMP-binding protein [Chloroflexota bacterium]